MDIEIQGWNRTIVKINEMKFYGYQYHIIAFEKDGELHISENKWGSGCGVILNGLNRDKSIRIPHKELMKLIKEL